MKPIYKNALVSVSNKDQLVETVQHLSRSGTRIVSTGGTARTLTQAGISVTSVFDQTKFPEVMDGRVKTLHPHIFLPLLARHQHSQDEQELKERNLAHFDLLICNLYPFEEALKSTKGKDIIEWIDVGGPSLLRAGAKNFEKVVVLCDPRDYELVKTGEVLSLEKRKELAAKVFSHLSVYDRVIADYLGKKSVDHPAFSIGGRFVKSLRYGENPQQKASWYRTPHQPGLHEAQLLQGKSLSFNNILDLHSAVSVLRSFKETASFVGVKHNNPCGVACASDLQTAVQKGLKADPVSIFGGIVALNQEVKEETAQTLSSIFLECIIAPSFSREALGVFSKKKNLRLLAWSDMLNLYENPLCLYNIDGGFLLQDSDVVKLNWNKCQIYGETPDENIKKDLEMAWMVCAYLKSNAIALVSDQQTVGLGMGQVDRVTSVKLACQRMETHHKDKIKSSVMASDGFFPFSDSVKLAAQKGIKWIIQPGGSIQDKDVLKSATDLGVTMVLTGTRHFKH